MRFDPMKLAIPVDSSYASWTRSGLSIRLLTNEPEKTNCYMEMKRSVWIPGESSQICQCWIIPVLLLYGIDSITSIAFLRFARDENTWPTAVDVSPSPKSYLLPTPCRSSKKQGRNIVYPGPIDPYFLAVILIPEPHFPQNFDPWAPIKKLIPSVFLHKILS